MIKDHKFKVGDLLIDILFGDNTKCVVAHISDDKAYLRLLRDYDPSEAFDQYNYYDWFINSYKVAIAKNYQPVVTIEGFEL